jgi:hypothetical protein
MNVKKWIRQHVQLFISREKITLSSELTISSKDSSKIISISQIEAELLNEKLNELKSCYPMLQTEMKNSMYGIILKISTCGRKVIGQNFYENYAEFLRGLIKIILADERLYVRLNVVGQIENCVQIEHFRYLNKDEQVSYKIIQTETKTNFIRKLKQKLGV